MHSKLQHLMIQYDAIRLIAILAIVLLHTAANGVTQLPAGSGDWWLANLADSAGRVGVPLFLMLSGAILLPRQHESTRHFYQRRWQRVALPALVWSLLYLSWAQFKGYWKQQPVDLETQLWGIVSGHSYFHLWFIYLLIGVYAVLPALRWLWLRLTPQQQLALTLTSLGLQQLGLMLRFYSNSDASAPWLAIPDWFINADQLPWPFWFIAYLPYLMLGALLRQPRPITAQQVLPILFFTAVATTACLYALQRLHFGPEPFYYAYHRLSLPVLLSALLLWLLVVNSQSSHVKKATSPAWHYLTATLLKHSFGIYLVHPIWLDLSTMLLQQPAFSALPYLARLPVQTLMILLASTLSCLIWARYQPNPATGTP